jgi:hypothetical protein
VNIGANKRQASEGVLYLSIGNSVARSRRGTSRLCFLGRILGTTEATRSLGSKGDAIRGAIEEANAEIVFERFDLKRNCGLGEKKVFRRTLWGSS